MKNLRRCLALTFASTFLILGSTACGDPGGSFTQRFTKACAESSNLPEALCECMAGRAEEELTENARNFLLASFEGDEARVNELRPEVGMAEAMEAGLFMTEVGECAPFLEGAG